MISETKPEPRWIPSFGNSAVAISAPTMPMTMSPMMPKPAPRTILPASQPAIRPTNRMTRLLSLDRYMAFPQHTLTRRSAHGGTIAGPARHDDPIKAFPDAAEPVSARPLRRRNSLQALRQNATGQPSLTDAHIGR